MLFLLPEERRILDLYNQMLEWSIIRMTDLEVENKRLRRSLAKRSKK